MRQRLLQVRAVGVVVLLASGLIGFSLGAPSSARASASQNALAARTEVARAPAAIGGPPANFENAGNWSMCLDADSNHYPANGDIVQLWSCNTHPEQEWVLTAAGQLQSAGTSMCLDVDSNHYANNGDRAQLWSCNTHPEQEWRFDWASSSFCASHDVPAMPTTFRGVTACGVPYASNGKSNLQGPVTYNGVQLDSLGFQCVELAARYFYYVTGLKPPAVDGNAYAAAVHQSYSQYQLSPVTSTYQSTLVPGDIISMWNANYKLIHVGVVTGVSLSTGKIYLINENANASGTDVITVTNGKMSYGGMTAFQWVYNLP